MEKVVIIGNGIAGITTARHVRKKSDKEIIVISAESKYFYSRTALMYIYMGHMRFEDTQPYESWFWEKNRIQLVQDRVNSIDFKSKNLSLDSGTLINYDSLVLATGSKPNFIGWPGQDLKGVLGMYSKQDLELLEELTPGTKEAVVVGGGLIGIELAEMMASRGIKVTFLVREIKFWGKLLPEAEADLIEKHCAEHHIDLKLNTELAEIIDDGSGRVGSVKTTSGEIIDCQIIGITIGVHPNIEFLKGSDLELDRGILVNEYLETNLPNVYALGDCAQFRTSINGRKAIEQIWYTGRIMGETLAATLCGERTAYNPGPWFNSAKFLDIEYQVYGWLTGELEPGDEWFVWSHPTEKKVIRVVWTTESGLFRGINLLGYRMRHELFDRWLKDGASIEDVMSNLRMANFDPEFSHLYETEIIASFNKATGKNIQLKPKSWWRKLVS